MFTPHTNISVGRFIDVVSCNINHYEGVEPRSILNFGILIRENLVFLKNAQVPWGRNVIYFEDVFTTTHTKLRGKEDEC